jgi:20S proteasome alpha/beta subunit
MSENIEIQLEPSDLAEPNNMTLITGSTCIDGVVIIADRKFTTTGTIGTRYQYGNKITGELRGILTAFSGDSGAFQVFVSALKNYVKAAQKEQIKYVLNNPLIGHYIGPSFEQVKLKVSQLLNEFYTKYKECKYNVLMGVSSKYSESNKSLLYYFESDGRIFPLSEPKAIGSGSTYAYYFLKCYWQDNKTTMKQFAQLGDFIIRHVSHDERVLDNAVGLYNQDHQYQYPQIVYIPDKPDEYCPLDEDGNQRIDCSPTTDELNEFRHNSLNMLRTLNDLPAPWSDG